MHARHSGVHSLHLGVQIFWQLCVPRAHLILQVLRHLSVHGRQTMSAHHAHHALLLVPHLHLLEKIGGHLLVKLLHLDDLVLRDLAVHAHTNAIMHWHSTAGLSERGNRREDQDATHQKCDCADCVATHTLAPHLSAHSIAPGPEADLNAT